MKKVWESTDGKIFDSWEECLEYENRCGKKLKSNNIGFSYRVKKRYGLIDNDDNY